MSDVTVSAPVDRSRFSLHEEEEVVEVPRHRRQIEYFETNLRAELPDRFVAGNIGVYWLPGERRKPWVGPDVLVSREPARDPKARVYVVWEDGPIAFITEVASDRTRRTERKKREQHYRVDLQVPEYLYTDLDRREIELWRLHEGEYQPVAPENGRLYSRELNVWFGWDADQEFVRIWATDGRMLPTWEEIQEQHQEAERRAREAEARAREADREREAARAAEARLCGQLREAEARAAEIAAELERLRRETGQTPEN